MCNHHTKNASGVTRRDLLRYGTAAATTFALLGPLGDKILPTAHGAIATQKHMTVINLFGGNDGVNTVIPVMPGVIDTYNTRRPDIRIDPNADGAHELRDRVTNELKYALHPTMDNIGRLYQDGNVAVINMVGYPNQNLSHFTSEDIWSRGVRGDFEDLGLRPSGWIARYLDQYAPRATGAISVGLGRRRDFTGGSTSPLVLSSTGRFRFDTDGRYGNNSQYRLELARQILQGTAHGGANGVAQANMDQAHSLIDATQAAITDYEDNFPNKATYQNASPSRQMQDIARLIHGGFDSNIFYTGFGGFDTHGDQGAAAADGRHGRLLQRLDDAVGSFEADMKAMGVWDNTLIVVISEFGRRNFENGSDGTDHGHGNCMFLIGGGVNGGLYGSDLTTPLLEENWLPGLVDFRDVYREILTNHLGAADLSTVFPEPQDNAFTPMGLFV